MKNKLRYYHLKDIALMILNELKSLVCAVRADLREICSLDIITRGGLEFELNFITNLNHILRFISGISMHSHCKQT